MERPFWIFDMDGTLTVPAHNFDQFKRDHGLPLDLDVLAGTATLAPEHQARVHEAIHDWELEIARSAVAQSDALALLAGLVARGGRVAVLTRNSKKGAHITLKAAGLDTYFADSELILGRDCAPAKPAPDGLALLMSRVGASASETVMVGDWVFDVMAGRNAGTATVLVERHGPSPEAWAQYCDRVVQSLDELLP